MIIKKQFDDNNDLSKKKDAKDKTLFKKALGDCSGINGYGIL